MLELGQRCSGAAKAGRLEIAVSERKRLPIAYIVHAVWSSITVTTMFKIG